MHILHVTPTYYPAFYWGGPIFSVYGINNALVKLPNVDLKVLTTDAASPKKEDNLEIKALDHDVLYPKYSVDFSHRIFGHSVSLEMLLKLPAMIRWADVIHLTAIYSFPTIPTLFLCRLWKKPVVWSPRGAFLTDERRAKIKRRNLKNLWIKVCNFIILPKNVTLHVTSDEERIASITKISNTNVVVIRNGVKALERLPFREYLPKGKMRLLFIGRLDPIKGVENLLEALNQLDDPSITLSIYGNGVDKYVLNLKNYASQLGLLNKNVYFLGPISGKLKANAFISSDVCVIPSFSENFSMVVAESLGHGVPVIASCKTPWKSVEEKQCGLWVDNTPESLVSAIKSIREMDLAKMGKNGWNWMKEEFGWDSIGFEIFELYKSSIRSICSRESI